MNISSDIDAEGKKQYHFHLTESQWNELTGVGEKKPKIHSIEKTTGDARYEKVIFTLTCKRFLRLKERWERSSFKSRLRILVKLGMPLDKAVEVYNSDWTKLPYDLKKHFD